MSLSAPALRGAAWEAGSPATVILQQRPSSTGPRLPAQGWGRCCGKRWAGAVAAVSGHAGEAPPVCGGAVAVVQ